MWLQHMHKMKKKLKGCVAFLYFYKNIQYVKF